jgi:hypothetical protein
MLPEGGASGGPAAPDELLLLFTSMLRPIARLRGVIGGEGLASTAATAALMDMLFLTSR